LPHVQQITSTDNHHTITDPTISGSSAPPRLQDRNQNRLTVSFEIWNITRELARSSWVRQKITAYLVSALMELGSRYLASGPTDGSESLKPGYVAACVAGR
jgi:hypothetical protein